ncbi:MAG: nucleotidyltransferase domain-containing protein [Thermomicrobiales bacterium]|nr:nucleotidyltransferase domain-containing protein [Thermomicrobiales bacterium]
MNIPAAITNKTPKPRPDIVTGEFVSTLRSAGVSEAYLFGSVSRGEEGPESDLDLFVRFDHEFTLAEQLNLMIRLSRLSGREVEVVTSIDPVFEPYILPSLVPIPLSRTIQ